jgi:hypothetical protein
MKQTKTTLTTMLAAIIVILLPITTTTTTIPATAQTTTTPLTPTVEPYIDEDHGFQVLIPTNWIVDDAADYGEGGDEEPSTISLETLGIGGAPAGTFCPQEAGQLQIGGEMDCLIPHGSDLISVGVMHYRFDLEHMQQFANLIEEAGRDITTNDLLIFELEEAKAPGALIGSPIENTNIQVISETDRTINLVDGESGEVIANDVQVKEVQYTYRSYFAELNNLPEPDLIETIMLVVYNNPEGNQNIDDVRAFKLVVGAQDANVQTTPPGTMLQRPEVRTVFDSFELLEEE